MLSTDVRSRGCVGSLQVLLVFQELAFLIAARTHGTGTLRLGESDTNREFEFKVCYTTYSYNQLSKAHTILECSLQPDKQNSIIIEHCF